MLGRTHPRRSARSLVSAAAASLIAAASLLSASEAAAQANRPLPASFIDEHAGKPRLLVLSDIGNEPDDQMSFVRLLVYSNDYDLEGIVATTSTWQKARVRPELFHGIIDGYAQVRPNLMLHARGWPTAEALRSAVVSGVPGYGMAALKPGPLTAGAQRIITATDRNDPRPLWISVWGGANTLAEALTHVRQTRAPEALAAFVSKLRVTTISDQDDAGPWIRREFPTLFYVGRPSTANADEYAYATWTGISGDEFYRNGEGADFTTVTNAWLDTNVRSKGPLGRLYPQYPYIMEGDTPAFLHLVDNGLASWMNPGWGGWGGRYVYRQTYGETRPMWTQGGDANSRMSSQDTVSGTDGRPRVTDQATIWRWREAFQHDFAARMDWTVKPYAQANHNPLVTVNGHAGKTPLVLDVKVGDAVTLDASVSRDPDGQRLRYAWFHYPEAGMGTGSLADVTVDNAGTARATVRVAATCRVRRNGRRPACPEQGLTHVILAVTDSGAPSLTSYKRVILRVRGASPAAG